MDASSVAAFAQDVIVQGIAAVPLRVGRQHQSAVLALVALDVETAIQRHHSYGLVLTRLGHYGQLADAATRSEFLVETLNAMYLIRSVHGKRYAVQTLPTDDAGEARGMIRLAGSSQYSVQYRSGANAALFQSVEIVLFAVRLAFQRVEGLPLEIDLAYEAAEATYVKDFVHRRAPGSFSLDLAPALRADAVYIAVFVIILHSLNQQIREHVNFFNGRHLALRLSRRGRPVAGVHGIVARQLRRWSRIDRLVYGFVRRAGLRTRSVDVGGIIARWEIGLVSGAPQLAVTRRDGTRWRRQLIGRRWKRIPRYAGDVLRRLRRRW